MLIILQLSGGPSSFTSRGGQPSHARMHVDEEGLVPEMGSEGVDHALVGRRLWAHFHCLEEQ